MKPRRDFLIVLSFSLVLLLGLVFVFSKVIVSKTDIDIEGETIEERITSFESSFNSLFSSNSLSLDLFSLTQRLLLKHETRSFEVLRANNGQLYLGSQSWLSEGITVEDVAEQILKIKDKVEEYGGHFIFCQVPYKTAEIVPELKYYADDTVYSEETALCDLLKEKGVDVLDLREQVDCSEYFKTDHHWTVTSAFNSSKHIVEKLGADYGFSFNADLSDSANYSVASYDKSLLGSIGVKVGPFFAGKDDFIIWLPEFDTSLELKHYNDLGNLSFSHDGRFEETFINKQLLEDKTYFNKYNALMYGAWCEAVIENRLAYNDATALLVCHSYGRAMTPYLSLHFKELRYIDPQKGRFNSGVINYIEVHHPDYVFFAFNDIMVI